MRLERANLEGRGTHHGDPFFQRKARLWCEQEATALAGDERIPAELRQDLGRQASRALGMSGAAGAGEQERVMRTIMQLRRQVPGGARPRS